MNITHALWRRVCLASAVLWMFGCAAAQQAPLRILVGFAPGGATDVVARVLAQGLKTELGRTVVVDNRPGAGGQIAAQALKQAKPDGNTLYLALSHTMAMVPLTMRNPGYDPETDFVHIALVGTLPNFFIINPEVTGARVDSLATYAQWVKRNPGLGNIGVPAPDFSVAVIAQAYGVDLRSVPYRGDAPLVQDLIAGQIPAGIASVAAALPHVQSGKLRLLAVDGTQRLPDLDIPTYRELGLQALQDVIFLGLSAPAGTAPAFVNRVNAAVNKVVSSRAFADRLSEVGFIPQWGSPEDMNAWLQASRRSNIELIRAANFQPQ